MTYNDILSSFNNTVKLNLIVVLTKLSNSIATPLSTHIGSQYKLQPQ